MACFNLIYQRYLETIKRKWIIHVIGKDSFDTIKIIADKDDIDP